MSKHTLGPWTCHSGMVWKAGPDVYPNGDKDGIPIAMMHREPGNGTMSVERDANARLIAAAPELLELAYAFESYLVDDSRSERRREQCLKEVRAVIAKGIRDMSIKRETAILEVYLDRQAELAEPEPKLRVYDRVGQVSAVIGIVLLVVWYWRML